MAEQERKLRFGIESLDELFGGFGGHNGILISEADNPTGEVPTTSVCLIGPDGAGKSVLAMHVAAHYAMDVSSGETSRPKILYVSTDLRREKAEATWAEFGLNRPWLRKVPGTIYPKFSKPPGTSINEIQLRPIDPRNPSKSKSTSENSFVSYLCDPLPSDVFQVGFVDLAARTAGDDWAYVNRIISMLESPEPKQPASLVIIDAIEGLEALSGGIDAFGEKRKRRSRIAQLLRNAVGKCNLVLVVEEAKPGTKHPEEFVTDAVIRLSVIQVRQGTETHPRRYLEIEKARAQTIVRGQHPLLIADGKGSFSRPLPQEGSSSTGSMRYEVAWQYRQLAHYDDPPAFIIREQKSPSGEPIPISYCSYLRVSHAIGYFNRKAWRQRVLSGVPVVSSQVNGFCSFDIPHLDNMLDCRTDTENCLSKNHEGLRFGTVTALVGENGTSKSLLAKNFLASAFFDQEVPQIAVAIGLDENDFQDLTGDIKKLVNVGKGRSVSCRELEHRLVYRRLNIQDRSSPVLFDIIVQTVKEAKNRLLGAIQKIKTGYDKLSPENCGNVRLVLTNLTTMRSVFPDVEADPLFLPAVVEFLRKEGVTSLLIATEPGSPNSERQSNFVRELRALVQHHICTWHVPFFGEDKVAISVIPPILSDRPAVIRELKYTRPQTSDKPGKLDVDPGFEMYTGLFEGESPQIVPVRVKLIGYGTGFNAYVGSLNALFGELYASAAPPVQGSDFAYYENLRSLSYLHSSTRMDHTLVLQVDEFWTGKRIRNKRPGLCDLKDYLDSKLTEQTEETNDPYRLFGATKADGKGEVMNRRASFNKESRTPMTDDRTDRVPFSWDFGFLMLRERAWKGALNKSLRINYKSNPDEGSVTVGEVLALVDPNGLFVSEWAGHAKNGVRILGNEKPIGPEKKAHLQLTDEIRDEAMNRIMKCRDKSLRGMKHLLWREFLHACVVAAKTDAAEDQGHALPFDVDTFAPETLSSLVIEVWFSEILISASQKKCADCGDASERCDFCKANEEFLRSVNGDQPSFESLDILIDRYSLELFRTFLMLGEVLSATQLGVKFVNFETRPAQQSAVASRHWFSTACPLMETHQPEDPLIPAALPGGFLMRGDWYLGIAHGSRSPRIGHRVVDVLSSRRSNINRLQAGMGLPTRDFVDPKFHEQVWTPLFRYSQFGSRQYQSYESIKRLGANHQQSSAGNGKESAAPQNGKKMSCRWLYRSSIASYDVHARLFSKLIGRVLHLWPSITRDLGMEGLSGFDHYDHIIGLTRNQIENNPELDKYYKPFKEFKDEILKGWESGLRYALSRPDEVAEAGGKPKETGASELVHPTDPLAATWNSSNKPPVPKKERQTNAKDAQI